MDSSSNSRPLLDSNSESEDLRDDESNVTIVCRPGASNRLPAHGDDDGDEQNTIDNTTTDEYEDDVDLLKSSNSAPNDRLSFTYIVFYLLGMTTLLPWNFFITAEDVSAFCRCCCFCSTSIVFHSIRAQREKDDDVNVFDVGNRTGVLVISECYSKVHFFPDHYSPPFVVRSNLDCNLRAVKNTNSETKCTSTFY